jgi:hypothetical protein
MKKQAHKLKKTWTEERSNGWHKDNIENTLRCHLTRNALMEHLQITRTVFKKLQTGCKGSHIQFHLLRRRRLGESWTEVSPKSWQDPIWTNKIGMVVHAWNPSYIGGLSRRTVVWGQLRTKKLIWKVTKAKNVGGVTQVAECLTSKCEALSSNSVSSNKWSNNLCLA